MTGHGSGLCDKVGISQRGALMISEVFSSPSDSEICDWSPSAQRWQQSPWLWELLR